MIIHSSEELRKKGKLKEAEIPDDIVKRKALESSAVQILLSPEKGKAITTTRQLDSGLNEITARIAAQHNTKIGINVQELKKATLTEKAERLSRIRQNIAICRKTKTKLALKSSSKEAKFIILSLNGSTQQAAEAQCF